jgi:hypothetical protein
VLRLSLLTPASASGSHKPGTDTAIARTCKSSHASDSDGRCERDPQFSILPEPHVESPILHQILLSSKSVSSSSSTAQITILCLALKPTQPTTSLVQYQCRKSRCHHQPPTRFRNSTLQGDAGPLLISRFSSH